MDLQRHWWKARGWTGLWPPLNSFRRFPPHCEICGRLENPLIDERFIAVYGVIIEDPPGYDFHWGWYCEQLNLVRPTGYLLIHHRYVCHRHGRFMRRSLTDCITGVKHTLLPQPPLGVMRLSNAFHKACYWLLVAARFLWFRLNEVLTVLHYKWWENLDSRKEDNDES